MKAHFIFLSAVIFFTFYFLFLDVFAFEATSTSFEIHAGAIDSVAGTSTSATFQNTSAGGQLATGSSTISGGTARQILSGVLYWLFGWYTPRYEQIHYRWRNNNGDETTATWAANEDTQLVNLQKATTTRLRFEISNEGWTRSGAPQFTIEYASTTTCSSGTYTAIPTVATTEHWQMSDSAYIADAAATTNVSGGLTDENSNFVAGQFKDTGNTTAAITLTSQDFTEIEYSIMATSTANDGGTYCFRATNNGSTQNMVYSETKYAKGVISSGLPVTGEMTSMIFDTTGLANGPAYNSIMWKGSLNNGVGKARFQFATSNSDTGPWNFIGGSACNSSSWYDVPNPDTPAEITCAAQNHNNQRYFRYRIQICSSDCSASGTISPTVTDVIISWSP